MNDAFVKYAIRRIFWVLPVIAFASLLVFSLIHLMPGSPASVLLPKTMRNERNIAILTELYRLDQPLYIQYLSYLWGILHLDMGMSFMERRPVWDIVSVGMYRTMLLGSLAVVIGTAVSIPLGVIGAVHKSTWVDDVARVFSIGGISLPEFWLALMVILVFAQLWNIFFGYPLIPASGYVPISNDVMGWFRHTIGPACVLAVPYGAIMSRITRASMADVLNDQYITTARSKGVRERAIIWGHAFKNALIPVVTVGAYSWGSIFNGSVLVETVFTYQGLGFFIYRAALNQDFPVVMGALVITVFIYVGLNLGADLAYAWLDPRISYEGGGQ